MTTNNEWITPAEAAQIVADAMAIPELAAQRQIGAWIDDEHIGAKSSEVVRWVDAPQNTPPPGEAADSAMRHRRFMTRFEGDLQRSVRQDHQISPQDWSAAARAAREGKADLLSIWQAAEMVIPIDGNWNLNSREIFSGIRFCRADIVRRLELTGHVAPAPRGRASYEDVIDWCAKWLAARNWKGGVNDAWVEFRETPMRAGVSKKPFFEDAFAKAKSKKAQ